MQFYSFSPSFTHSPSTGLSPPPPSLCCCYCMLSFVRSPGLFPAVGRVSRSVSLVLGVLHLMCLLSFVFLISFVPCLMRLLSSVFFCFACSLSFVFLILRHSVQRCLSSCMSLFISFSVYRISWHVWLWSIVFLRGYLIPTSLTYLFVFAHSISNA